MRHLCTFLCCWLIAFQLAAAQTDHAAPISSLIDPAKLATLSERDANPRVPKAVHWLATARSEGQKPTKVLDRAVALARYKKAAGKLTKKAALRNCAWRILTSRVVADYLEVLLE